MISSALALTLVLISSGTEVGASTEAAGLSGHRHHTLCENTDGNRRGGNWGASRVFAGRGRPIPPFLPIAMPPASTSTKAAHD